MEDTKTGYKIVYDENGQNFLTYRPNTDIFDIEQSEQARALIAENETLDGFRFDEIAQKGNINEATITTEGIAINKEKAITQISKDNCFFDILMTLPFFLFEEIILLVFFG